METKAIIEIFLVFILPVIVWYAGLVSVRFRFIVFYLMCLTVTAIVFIENWNFTQLGIRLDNFSSSMPAYIIFTVIATGVLYLLAKFQKRGIVAEWKTNSHFIYGFITLSTGQEFIYRGFLMPVLLSLLNPLAAIIINACVFSLVHVIYPEIKTNLPLIFVAGLAFAAIYYYFPNLILISLSHIILNYIAVMFGYFSFFKIKTNV